jgi:KaiC/GvpD/RAD55 family RecA-like ATPase
LKKINLEKLMENLFGKTEKENSVLAKRQLKTPLLVRTIKPEKEKIVSLEVLPTRVSKFDELVNDNGIERRSTILLSGGCGTGKTTFCLQSLYYGALNGEKGVFISFEEEPYKIKFHMKKNFGWDFEKLEKKGLISILRFDPTKIARSVEEAIENQVGMLRIKFEKIELPFKPDRIVIDSLSALSISFENEENYRKYLRHLFETLESYNSVNFVISETEQDPKVYSRSGIEEFLADGVIVLYNLKVDGQRKNALEILKLRSSGHLKKMIPYTISSKGIEIMIPKN